MPRHSSGGRKWCPPRGFLCVAHTCTHEWPAEAARTSPTQITHTQPDCKRPQEKQSGSVVTLLEWSGGRHGAEPLPTVPTSRGAPAKPAAPQNLPEAALQNFWKRSISEPCWSVASSLGLGFDLCLHTGGRGRAISGAAGFPKQLAPAGPSTVTRKGLASWTTPQLLPAVHGTTATEEVAPLPCTLLSWPGLPPAGSWQDRRALPVAGRTGSKVPAWPAVWVPSHHRQADCPLPSCRPAFPNTPSATCS